MSWIRTWSTALRRDGHSFAYQQLSSYRCVGGRIERALFPVIGRLPPLITAFCRRLSLEHRLSPWSEIASEIHETPILYRSIEFIPLCLYTENRPETPSRVSVSVTRIEGRGASSNRLLPIARDREIGAEPFADH